MEIGMLWFDNDKAKDVASKVTRAADYYRKKYGQTPNLCFVHPSMVPEPPTKNGSTGENHKMSSCEVEIRTNIAILPNHFWIGVH